MNSINVVARDKVNSQSSKFGAVSIDLNVVEVFKIVVEMEFYNHE